VGEVAAAGPDHVSVYQLTFESGTRMERDVRACAVAPPEDEAAREAFLAAHDRLAADGFVHYEISNYARSGHESVHNWGYWSGRDVLGMGPDAASRRGIRPAAGAASRAVRWRNTAAWGRYLAALDGGRLPVGTWEHVGPDAAGLEALFLGLRTRAGWRPPDAYPPEPLARWGKAGLLDRTGGRVVATMEGWLLSDELCADLARWSPAGAEAPPPAGPP
jgi:oxygen-independent coproporphyrinogen-3 oxidase